MNHYVRISYGLGMGDHPVYVTVVPVDLDRNEAPIALRRAVADAAELMLGSLSGDLVRTDV